MSPRFIALLGLGQILAWGSLYYSFPQLAGPLAAALGLTRDGVYAAASLALGLAALAAYPIGRWIDQGLGRVVMTGGHLLGGTAFVLLSFTEEALWIYPLFAAIGVAQAMTLYEPAFAIIARRDIDRARDGILKLTLWAGFSSTVFIPLIEAMLTLWDWRVTVRLLGGSLLLIGTTLHWHLLEGAPAQAAGSRAAPVVLPPMGPLLRRPVFWALLLSFTAYAITFSTLSMHLYPLLVERGAELPMLVLALAVIGPAQVLGRVLVWRWGGGLSVRQVGLGTAIALPLSILLLALLPPSTFWLFSFALLYGAANGVMTIVRGIAVPEMLSRQAYGSLNGLMAVPAMAVRAAAPFTAAALWSLNQNYDLVLAAVLGAGVLLTASFAAAVYFSRPSAPPADASGTSPSSSAPA